MHGDLYGQYCLFNDLSREIASLFVIPLFMRHSVRLQLGLRGRLQIDCTCHLFKKREVIEVTPIAISPGFVKNILPPLLLVFFQYSAKKRNTKTKELIVTFRLTLF